MRPSLRGLVASLSLVLAGTALAACGSSGPSSSLPTVSTGFETNPVLSFPSSGPPGGLKVKVLHTGTGPVVAKGDLLIANYLGQIWRGKVFDSSFGRDAPSDFPIGVGSVIPGWDKTLVGQHVGSRVLLVIPPVDGYGASGNKQAGITGKDTLVFVVDILGTYSKGVSGAGATTPLTVTDHDVTVQWRTGAPKITRDAGFVAPAHTSFTVLSVGSGPDATNGLIVVQYEVVDLQSGAIEESTWTSLPQGETVGGTAQQSILDSLPGKPVGSRVLYLLPKSQGGPYAIAAEIVASYPLQHF